MARPQQVSDEEIIEAARACILEFGPGVSTTKIAECVDVSAQALLKRFGGKENLVVAALKPLVESEWSAYLPDSDDPRGMAEQLREVAIMGAEFFQPVIHALFAVKWSDVPPERLVCDQAYAPPVSAIFAISAWLERLYARGMVRQLDFQACALGFLGAIQVHGVLEQAIGEAPVEGTKEEYIDTVVEIYAAMLAPETRSAPVDTGTKKG